MTDGRKRSRGPLVLSLLIITLGVGWLLTARGWGGGVDWVWTLGLGLVGVLSFVLSGGVDKVSIVLGPFFLVASVLSILRQRGMLKAETEIPVLVILVGVLLLFSYLVPVRAPSWYVPQQSDDRAAS